jgi:hypothetical protein
MKKLLELKYGEKVQVNDIILEAQDERDISYVVYKVNIITVSAYSQNMTRRIFPDTYKEGYKGILCKHVAKVFRYQKNEGDG